ncbi:hypothetical protein MJ1HA_2612 [Metallosphaera sedula]|nr:hypothetical protein MJ1HA_2612 [Metallosphaera sedula]
MEKEIKVTLSNEQYAKIREIAKKNSLTMASLVKTAIAEYLRKFEA